MKLIEAGSPPGETPAGMLDSFVALISFPQTAVTKSPTVHGTEASPLFAARQGRANWSHAPYGYRLIHKTESAPQKLVVNETGAEVVRQIFR